MYRLYHRSKFIIRFRHDEDDTLNETVRKIVENYTKYHGTEAHTHIHTNIEAFLKSVTIVKEEDGSKKHIETRVKIHCFYEFAYKDVLKQFIEMLPYPFGLQISILMDDTPTLNPPIACKSEELSILQSCIKIFFDPDNEKFAKNISE